MMPGYPHPSSGTQASCGRHQEPTLEATTDLNSSLIPQAQPLWPVASP